MKKFLRKILQVSKRKRFPNRPSLSEAKQLMRTKDASLCNFCVCKSCVGFTIMELLIAISIFSIIATVGSGLYIRSFRETRQTNLQNQVFEDARFLLFRLSQEVRENAIDYDEYYNKNVVIPSGNAVPNRGIANFGQNFGRYYSAFFNPGEDFTPGTTKGHLGFDCNNSDLTKPINDPARIRNQPNCMPLRKTIDRNTGSNPFDGKYNSNLVNTGEDAFCGSVSYTVLQNGLGNRFRKCTNGLPDFSRQRVEDQLYLISSDAKTKTIFAREAIGRDSNSLDVYALSLLKMSGHDTNGDSAIDSFTCAEGFQCRGQDDVRTVTTPLSPDLNCVGQDQIKGELPRANFRDRPDRPYDDLLGTDVNADPDCDSKAGGFSKDFVPISPLRMNIKTLNFYITPSDDPYYAFAETSQLSQPKVTIVLTVELNPELASPTDKLEPITLVETVSSGVRTPIPAPLLVE